MYLRLAFAVAAHLEPEILLIDEVLAVGDAEFQKKCINKMGSVSKQGKTVLFVSHNMLAITQLCQRAIWLENGKIKINDLTNDVVSSYLSSGIKGEMVWHKPIYNINSDYEVTFLSARLLSKDGYPTSVVNFNSLFRVEISYDLSKPIRNLSIAYQLFDSQGILVFESMDSDMPNWKNCTRDPGQYLSICEVPAFLLKPGRYYLSIVSFIERIKIIERQERILTFDVSTVGYSLNPGRLGVVSPLLTWNVTRMNGKGDTTK
jgi:lipopolysaccharide transport system ATP-binding protein